MNEYMLAALFWGLGGFVNGVAGFGAALIAMPLVTGVIDMSIAVPSCTLIALTMNVMMTFTYRQSADWKRIRPLIIGAFPGAVAGVTILSHVPEHTLKLGMGSFLVLYSLYSLFLEGRFKQVVSPRWGYTAGFASAAIGSAFGMGGPPTIVYTSLAGWSKDTIKAGIGAFFLCAGCIMASVQLVAGLHTVESCTVLAFSAPAILVGTKLGIWVSLYIGEVTYRKLLFGFLTFMGASIVYRALSMSSI